MTLINVDIEDSGKQPLVGYIQVTLDYRLNTTSGRSLQAVSKKYPLDVNGQTVLDLEPSLSARVTYYFEVYRSVTVNSVTVDTLVDSFHALVPDSLTPILWTELSRQTGITKDDMDASLMSVVRRLLVSNDFWIGVGQNTFKVKGEYSSTAYYSIGDIVSFNGNGYMSISQVSIINTAPNPNGDNTFWRIIVRKGATGSGTLGDAAPYSTSTWVDDIAPSRNAVKTKIETLATKAELTGILTNSALDGTPNLVSTIPTSDSTSRPASTAWVQARLAPVAAATVPVGTVVNFAGSSAPTGWLLCDGRLLTRTTYASLFATIGTTFNTGGEAGTQFRLPDLRGRMAIAPDTSSVTGAAGRVPSAALADVGGTQTTTLTVANLPAHGHQLTNSATLNAQQFTATGLANGSTGYYALIQGGGGSATMQPASTGSGTSFNTMTPYQVLNYIIYTGV